MEIFVFLLICAVAVLAVYGAKTRKEVSQLREAVSALIAEMRQHGMEDVVDAAKERASRTMSQEDTVSRDAASDYVKIVREPARRPARNEPERAKPIADEKLSEPLQQGPGSSDSAQEPKPAETVQPEPPTVSDPYAEPARPIQEDYPEPESPAYAPMGEEEGPYVEAEPYLSRPTREPQTLSEKIEEIGGKLPIWVGGISLIFGGFFLVRYGIEAGIFGPTVRVVMAAIFGIALIAASEAGRIWTVLDEDKRLGQSLAGAGIAICYGTLYMAGELYALIGPITAFILLVIVTSGALLLSLKRGAPTAIMGLLGGFAAPYVAGLGPDSAGPLLIYLAIFTAGLFALSIHRGWLWLAMLASGGSVLWSSALMISGVGGASPILGVFIVGLAISGVLVLEKIAKDNAHGSKGLSSLLRLSPIAIGLLQLAIFAPLIEFTLMGWLFYGALSIFAIIYAWRDPFMAPAPMGALALAIVMLFGAIEYDGSNLAMMLAIGFAIVVLFCGSGHWLAFRKRDGWLWSLMAIAAPIGVFGAFFITLDSAMVSNAAWGIYALIAAAPIAWLAWRAKSSPAEFEERFSPIHGDLVLVASTMAAALLMLVPAIYWPAAIYVASAILLVAILLAFWGRYTQNFIIRHIPVAAIFFASVAWLGAQFSRPDFIASIGESDLPQFILILAFAIIPSALLGALTWLSRDLLIGKAVHWLAALPVLLAIFGIVPPAWHVMAFATLTLLAGLGALRRFMPDLAQEALLSATILYLLSVLLPFAAILSNSLVGETLHYELLPRIGNSVGNLILPVLVLAITWWLSVRGERERHPLWTTAIGLSVSIPGIAVAYLLLKQLLQIDMAEEFVTYGFFERALFTQFLFLAGFTILRPDLFDQPELETHDRRFAIGILLFAIGMLRFIYFDVLLLNPVFVEQSVGTAPIVNLLTCHLGLTTIWIYLIAKTPAFSSLKNTIMTGALFMTLVTAFATVKQSSAGSIIAGSSMTTTENYLYSAVLVIIAIAWLWRGLATGSRLLRVAGMVILALAAAKVFLIDAAALDGILRVLSFIGFGFAALGIGWFYSRIMGRQSKEKRNDWE